jgi:hypothetical protein
MVPGDLYGIKATTMTREVFIICLLGSLLMGTSLTQAQPENIIISDDLAASAEGLKVKIGAQTFGKIYKFKFGEYTVVQSKMGWTVTSEKSNLFNTKTESKTENKFSFVLSNKSSDSAFVNAMSNIEVKELQSMELFPNLYFGEDELSGFSDLFLSFITTSDNKDENWVLHMAETYGSDVENRFVASLSNGVLTINIIPASSNKNGDDSRMFPALGYEFVLNEQSIGAMQYYGGGALGYNKNIVWLKSELEPEMKLVLAAAMTSLMQIKGP